MVGKKISISPARGLAVICFMLMLIAVLARVVFVLFLYLGSGSPVPGFVFAMAGVSCAMALSLIFYFKWPWIAVIISWVDITFILLGIFPWVASGISNFVHQFGLDIVFCIAAHAGLFSYSLSKIRRVQPELR